MPAVSCHCGARYNVPASAIGRRWRCKKCGEQFEIRPAAVPDQAVSLDDLSALERGSTAAAPGQPRQDRQTPSRDIPPEAVPPGIVAYAAQDVPADEAGGVLLTFFGALARVFLFPARPRNLITFLTTWTVLATAVIGSSYLFAYGSVRSTLLGLAVFVLTEGAFAAFCFNAVRQAAEGEEELPGLPLTEGVDEIWRTIIAPLLAFAGTVLLALAPATIGLIGVSFLPASGTLAPVGKLLAIGGMALLGLFLWPMFVLSLVMGDTKALLRFGPMVVTVLRTIVPYTCTVLLVYGTAAVLVFGTVLLTEGESAPLAVIALVVGLRVYTQIVAMRAIGVYYYHNAERFDWL